MAAAYWQEYAVNFSLSVFGQGRYIFMQLNIVEPEKQALLANGSEKTFVSRQGPRNRQRNDVRC
jgi:hypothetical protein